MPEMLPAKAPVRNQVKDIADIEGKLLGSFRVIDAADSLNSAYKNANDATKEKGLYYRTDHHWTSLGALAVFQDATSTLGLSMEGVTYTPHTVSESFRGTLASRSGNLSHEDTIVVYEPTGTDIIYNVYYPDSQLRSRSMFMVDQLKEKDQYTVFFGGNHPVVEIETTSQSGRNLLIFKDSYANSILPYLIGDYSRIVMIDDRYTLFDAISTAEGYSPDEIAVIKEVIN
jgi:hypothetical protein